MTSQPNPSIPVFQVRREHGRGGIKTLHRNLLLPFMGLPVRKAQLNPSHENDGPELLVQTEPITDSSFNISDNTPENTDVPKYVIPQRRTSTLNPKAEEFVPKRSSRTRLKPAWLRDKHWIT